MDRYFLLEIRIMVTAMELCYIEVITTELFISADI